jgi:hypothetical protein
MDPELPQDPRAVAKLLRELAPQPPANPADLGPWDFLERVAPDAKEQLVRPALHELLSDRDEIVCKRSIEALTNLPESDGTLNHLIAKARAHMGSGEVGDALQHALSVYAPTSSRGREITDAIKRLAGNELPLVSTMSVIGRFDPTFSLTLARRHAAGDYPARAWTSLVMSVTMYHRDQLLDLLRILSALPDASKDEVLGEATQTLAASEAHFQAWATHDGLAAPTHSKPTAADCRAALGLHS